MSVARRRIALFLAAALGVAYLLFVVSVTPSNDREWSTDLAILPYAEFSGDSVTIRNIRNFSYRSVLDYTPSYYDKTFDLNAIRSVDFIVEPFSGVAAHTFLAFGFEDGSYVDISVEIRRERGEFYNIFKGLARQYELTYVIADERDVLRLRTNYRKGEVYLYPVETSKEKMRAMFVSMLERANALREQPEFYNTLTNNCTTNIARHVNEVTPRKIPIDIRLVFVKYSDELARDAGLISGEGSMDELRAAHLITPTAQQYGDSPDFSEKIRRL